MAPNASKKPVAEVVAEEAETETGEAAEEEGGRAVE